MMIEDSLFDSSDHHPVLYQETIHLLRPVQGGRYIDGTLGAGGHAYGVLQASSPDGMLLGLDLDPQALATAQKRLASFGGRVILRHSSYSGMKAHMATLGWSNVQGVLLDLGFSSMQIDTPERGFSFQVDAPLDMRFNPESGVTAADLVNTLEEADLVRILFDFGEERYARRIARLIIQARPLRTTKELADIVLRTFTGKSENTSDSDRRRKKKIHPATRTFQALRIAVNRELEALETVLPDTVEILSPGGRLAIISFHSLEDRIVKRFFRKESSDCLCPPTQPVCNCGHKATLKEITRRPIVASNDEIVNNPRARSARLRVAERI